MKHKVGMCISEQWVPLVMYFKYIFMLILFSIAGVFLHHSISTSVKYFFHHCWSLQLVVNIHMT